MLVSIDIYFCGCKTGVLPSKQFKNLDPPYKMALDISDCFKRMHFLVNFIRSVVIQENGNTWFYSPVNTVGG